MCMLTDPVVLLQPRAEWNLFEEARVGDRRSTRGAAGKCDTRPDPSDAIA